jgi:hypothetical protein
VSKWKDRPGEGKLDPAKALPPETAFEVMVPKNLLELDITLM